MPIYEYLCTKCGHKQEVLQKMGVSNAGVPCEMCGNNDLKKVISAYNVGKTTSAASIPSCSADGGCCGRCGCGLH